MSGQVLDNGGQGNMPPPKPWERVGSSSGPSPFNPSSTGPASTVLASAGVAKSGEKNLDTERSVPVANRSTVGRLMPPRPWEQNRGGSYGSNFGGYGSMSNYGSGYGTMANYNSGYGSGTYGGLGGYGGAMGGPYSSGHYGNNMYRGYGGMYNNGMGGPVGGYGLGPGGPYANGDGDPNNPFGGPPSPPSFWQSMLHVVVLMLGIPTDQLEQFLKTRMMKLTSNFPIGLGGFTRYSPSPDWQTLHSNAAYVFISEHEWSLIRDEYFN